MKLMRRKLGEVKHNFQKNENTKNIKWLSIEVKTFNFVSIGSRSANENRKTEPTRNNPMVWLCFLHEIGHLDLIFEKIESF